MDRFSKIGVAAIAFALRDARMEHGQNKREIGIISTTRYGCLSMDAAYFETVFKTNGELASPNLFAFTLPTTFLGEASILFGLRGPCFVVNEPGTTSELTSVRLSLQNLACHAASVMVCGFCDIGPPRQFPEMQDNVLRGAVFLVLEKEIEPFSKQAYGEIEEGAESKLFFDGQAVESLAELVTMGLQCL